MAFYSDRLIPVFPLFSHRRNGVDSCSTPILLPPPEYTSAHEYRARGARFLAVGVDHNMGRKPWAKALRLISRNALAYGLVRLMILARLMILVRLRIDASQCCGCLSRLVTN
jgi:hypothetical protein